MATGSVTKHATHGDKSWYVFYIPEGRMPKSFGGKSGWDWPKAYFGPYESRTAASLAAKEEMAVFELAAARYKVRNASPRQFVKLWGRPPERHFAHPWSVGLKKRDLDLTCDATGLAPLDHVLGGGLVLGSVVLFAGSAGVGRRALYVTSEETRATVGSRADRVGASTPSVHLLAERDLDKALIQARRLRAQVIAIDSIQKMYCEGVGGRAGSPTQMKACTERLVDFAKKTDTTVWITSATTHDGSIAGPKMMEHSADVVLELVTPSSRSPGERILRCAGKNRFGTAGITVHLELLDRGLVPLAS